jgi:hypothetical protein
MYSFLFAYEAVETLCLGPTGLFTLLSAVSCLFLRLGDANENEVSLIAGMVVSDRVIRFDGAVLVSALLARVWRWCEAGEASPWQRAASGYELWLREMEERELAEQLSRAFWRADGAGTAEVGTTVRTQSRPTRPSDRHPRRRTA